MRDDFDYPLQSAGIFAHGERMMLPIGIQRTGEASASKSLRSPRFKNLGHPAYLLCGKKLIADLTRCVCKCFQIICYERDLYRRRPLCLDAEKTAVWELDISHDSYRTSTK
jgi:hypothetical protein